jgi:hypothetical protein
MNPVALVGASALVAVVATIVGAVTLVLFFARGGFWGLLNDIASIVLMVAMIPVAVALGRLGEGTFGAVAWLVTAIGIAGMVGATIAQSLLVARVRTYTQLLPWTLGASAVVGLWYVLVGVLGIEFVVSSNYPVLLIALALASGLGYIAIGYGFLRGNERHPLSVAGGLVLFVASTAFLSWIAFLTLLSGPTAA